MAKENETETTTTNETPSAEDYEALKAELEAEKQKAQTLVTEATQSLTEKVAMLEGQVSTYATDAQALQEKLDLVNKDFEGAKAAYAYAVEDYKKLVLQTNPLFTPEIIWGDTIEDVKTSVEKAGVLVSKVKEGIEAQSRAVAGLTTVPAGAPARSETNTESLSTKEKINLGLELARKKKE